MPAQDIPPIGGQATSDPHAQLLSIQEKIAKQTGGVAPIVASSSAVPPTTGVNPPRVVSVQTQVPEPPKPIVKPVEIAAPLPEDKVPPSVVDDVVSQLNGAASTVATPAVEPVPTDASAVAAPSADDSRWVAPAEPTAASTSTVNQPSATPATPPRLEGFDPKDKNLLKPSQGNQGDMGDKGVVREDMDDTKGGSAAVVNPQAVEELTRADIFKMLGMGQITEQEKKKNLDEMEETIWQDFVESDLPQMLSGEQKEKFLDLLKTAPSAEKVINFFGNPPAGGLPQDFEQKYLKKTLDFKAEIVKEQIETLMLANEGRDAQKVEILKSAKAAAAAGEWKKVEEMMGKYQ